MLRDVFRAVVALLAAVALAVGLFPTAVVGHAAGGEGVIYLPPTAKFTEQFEKEIVSNYAISVPAATQDATTGNVIPGTFVLDLSQYLPSGFTVEAVKVRLSGADNAKIVALDANGTTLASVDVVPLASGFEAVFPANTTQIQFENYDLAAVWSDTVTVVVLSTISVSLQFGVQSIEVQGGQAIVPVTVIVEQLPVEGSFSLADDKAEFDIHFFDSADADGDGKTAPDKYIYSQAHNDPANPLSISTDIRILTSAQPGTYTVKLTMYFHENYRLEGDPGQGFQVGDGVALTISLQGDAGGATDQPPAEEEQASEGINFTLVAMAAGALVILAIVLKALGGRS